MSRPGNPRTACNLCRYRKIRCDKAQPACETCRYAGVVCTFSELPRKKTVQQQLEETRAHLQQVEQDQLQPTGLFGPREFDAAFANFRWQVEYCTPYNLRSSLFDFEAFANQLTKSFHFPPVTRTTQGTTPKWPSRALVQQSIDCFSSQRLYSIFPMVQSDTLKALISSGALNPHTDPPHAANRALLVAFTAMVIRNRRNDPAFAQADPDAYVDAALSLLPQLALQHHNPRALEALITLVLYIAPIGQPRTAELLLAMAVRVLYNLGGNINSNRPRDPIQLRHHDHLRALFWLCYAIDKEISLRKCQAPLINDADCDLDLPASYVSLSSNHQFLTYELSLKELLYPTDLRLALIKSKIYHQLYSHQSKTHTKTRRLQLIRELDQELNDLKSNFPINCQPEAITTSDTSDTFIHDLSLRGINMHLEYYHCLAKIHDASTTTPVSLANESSSPPSSSMELCYQAQRSTLLYISRMRHLINPDTFWIYAQFLLTALLSIHYNLITNPAEPSFQQDLQILESLLGVFVDLTNANNGRCFPPFVIIQGLIRNLVGPLKR